MQDLGLIVRALHFAAEKHRLQKRKDNLTPYINHPIEVMGILQAEGGIEDPQILAAALLHDTLEDTATSVAELSQQFGPEVCAIVQEVSDDKSLPKAVRKQLQIAHAPRLSPAARAVKLADKIANLRDLKRNPPPDWTPERIAQYFSWAKAVVDGLRGQYPQLEAIFDASCKQV